MDELFIEFDELFIAFARLDAPPFLLVLLALTVARLLIEVFLTVDLPLEDFDNCSKLCLASKRPNGTTIDDNSFEPPFFLIAGIYINIIFFIINNSLIKYHYINYLRFHHYQNFLLYIK